MDRTKIVGLVCYIPVSNLDIVYVYTTNGGKKDQLFLISTIVDIFISNMSSAILIRLERDATDRPWGFRLQGLNEQI
jgi:hypothetical protein